MMLNLDPTLELAPDERVIFPPPLQPRASIAVVAPSGPFDAALLQRGLAHLSIFQIQCSASMFARQKGYLAGSDEERWEELQTALDHPELGGILIARGGYGLGRIVDRLDLTRFRQHPKWVVGFSDATVLHARLWKEGYASLHAPNGTTLAQAQEEDVGAVLESLLGRLDLRLEGEGLFSGIAEGTLLGGNLTTLFTEAAAGRLQIPKGTLLLLEDVTETSYRIDRMLDALRARGIFDNCSGLVFGEFTDCSPGKFQVPVEEVLRNCADAIQIPCATSFPIGHGTRNRAVPLGAKGRLTVRGPGAAELIIVPPPTH